MRVAAGRPRLLHGRPRLQQGCRGQRFVHEQGIGYTKQFTAGRPRLLLHALLRLQQGCKGQRQGWRLCREQMLQQQRTFHLGCQPPLSARGPLHPLRHLGEA